MATVKNNFFVDVECIRLAEHFLQGWKPKGATKADDVRELAEQFQSAAEDFCEDMEEEDGRG